LAPIGGGPLPPIVDGNWTPAADLFVNKSRLLPIENPNFQNLAHKIFYNLF